MPPKKLCFFLNFIAAAKIYGTLWNSVSCLPLWHLLHHYSSDMKKRSDIWGCTRDHNILRNIFLHVVCYNMKNEGSLWHIGKDSLNKGLVTLIKSWLRPVI